MNKFHFCYVYVQYQKEIKLNIKLNVRVAQFDKTVFLLLYYILESQTFSSKQGK